MKLFNFLTYFCLVNSFLTIFYTSMNGSFNALETGICLLGFIISLAIIITKKSDLTLFLTIWYILATLLLKTIYLIFSTHSGFMSFGIGKFLRININPIYLIPTILIIAYYSKLVFLNKKITGTVHTNNGDLPFGTVINFTLDDFKDSKITGNTDFIFNDISYTHINFQKIKNPRTKLAKIKIYNETNALHATISF